jgi:hypothetical protein
MAPEEEFNDDPVDTFAKEDLSTDTTLNYRETLPLILTFILVYFSTTANFVGH